MIEVAGAVAGAEDTEVRGTEAFARYVRPRLMERLRAIGLDVEYYRVISQPGHADVRQRFFWRYQMYPDKYVVGKAATPPSTPPSTPPGSTTAPATPPPTSVPTPPTSAPSPKP